MLGYVIWDVSPEIFSFGIFAVRWYGLLFALSFLIGQAIIAKIFKIEGKPEKDLEVLMIHMVLATIVGARLGHCFFYEPSRFLSNPIEILKVWKGGLASHGAAVGILLAIFLYSRSRAREGQSFWWVIDRIVIVVALGGAFIRLGNLMNSEIIGKPADVATSFVFANHISKALPETVDKRSFSKIDKDTNVENVIYKKVKLRLHFRRKFYTKESAKSFITERFYSQINGKGEVSRHFQFFKEPKPSFSGNNKHIIASFDIWVIPRHPAQFYESLSSFLIFLLLLFIYSRKKGKTPEGLLFGIFMIAIFTLRFFYEFLKENQVDFENSMSLNMGQILSLPAIAIGIVAIVLALTRKKKEVKA